MSFAHAALVTLAIIATLAVVAAFRPAGAGDSAVFYGENCFEAEDYR
jgi:hypothetical protein